MSGRPGQPGLAGAADACAALHAGGAAAGAVAPAVLWTAKTGGQTHPARLLAVGTDLAVGLIARNPIAAVVAGAVTLSGVPMPL